MTEDSSLHLWSAGIIGVCTTTPSVLGVSNQTQDFAHAKQACSQTSGMPSPHFYNLYTTTQTQAAACTKT